MTYYEHFPERIDRQAEHAASLLKLSKRQLAARLAEVMDALSESAEAHGRVNVAAWKLRPSKTRETILSESLGGNANGVGCLEVGWAAEVEARMGAARA